jgi:hypothetical protein
VTDARLRAWRGWRAAAGPFARFVHPAPFTTVVIGSSASAGPASPLSHRRGGGVGEGASFVVAAVRALAPLSQSTVAIIDLPLPAALAAVRGASVAAVRPWIVLIVPRLNLPASSIPVDDLVVGAPAPPRFDRDWWREVEPTPAPRTAWFVLDSDRGARFSGVQRRTETDAPYEIDADHLPPATDLRRAGYDAITIVGRRAVPAPDLGTYVAECLASGMRIRCVVA